MNLSDLRHLFNLVLKGIGELEMEARQTECGNKSQQSNELLEELCQKQGNSPALKSSVQSWQPSAWAAWCEPEVMSVMQELL